MQAKEILQGLRAPVNKFSIWIFPALFTGGVAVAGPALLYAQVFPRSSPKIEAWFIELGQIVTHIWFISVFVIFVSVILFLFILTMERAPPLKLRPSLVLTKLSSGEHQIDVHIMNTNSSDVMIHSAMLSLGGSKVQENYQNDLRIDVGQTISLPLLFQKLPYHAWLKLNVKYGGINSSRTTDIECVFAAHGDPQDKVELIPSKYKINDARESSEIEGQQIFKILQESRGAVSLWGSAELQGKDKSGSFFYSAAGKTLTIDWSAHTVIFKVVRDDREIVIRSKMERTSRAHQVGVAWDDAVGSQKVFIDGKRREDTVEILNRKLPDEQPFSSI